MVAGTHSEAGLPLPAAFRGLEAVQAHLSQDRLVVAWQSSAPHVDTWVVEWLPDLDSEPPTLSWEAVTGASNWTIPQGSPARTAPVERLLLVVSGPSRGSGGRWCQHVTGWAALLGRSQTRPGASDSPSQPPAVWVAPDVVHLSDWPRGSCPCFRAGLFPGDWC